MGSWFYALLGSAFVSLLIMALVAGEWLAAVLAAMMIAVTLLAARYIPRLSRAADESTQHYYGDGDRAGKR
jgi:membrane protein implicated in regulation of membrane protease activity